MRVPSATGDVYCLATSHLVLSSSRASALPHVLLYAPDGRELSRGLPRDWVCRVFVDAERGVTLVQLTTRAAHALVAAGATCRAVGTAAAGMRATHVKCKDSSGVFEEAPATIARVDESAKILALEPKFYDGLLVGADGSLLAVTRYSSSHDPYSLAETVNEFLEERMWQMRYSRYRICTMISFTYDTVFRSHTVSTC